MSKARIIKDYEKLPNHVVEQIKLVYPLGFTNHLVSFFNKDGKQQKALPFETEDYYYLIRMSAAEAVAIIEDDMDYDEDGVLTKSARDKYTDKHDDEDFLNSLNSNDDNDLGFEDEDKTGN